MIVLCLRFLQWSRNSMIGRDNSLLMKLGRPRLLTICCSTKQNFSKCLKKERSISVKLCGRKDTRMNVADNCEVIQETWSPWSCKWVCTKIAPNPELSYRIQCQDFPGEIESSAGQVLPLLLELIQSSNLKSDSRFLIISSKWQAICACTHRPPLRCDTRGLEISGMLHDRLETDFFLNARHGALQSTFIEVRYNTRSLEVLKSSTGTLWII